MGYSIKPIGCNGECGSCYELRIRNRGLERAPNFEKIIATLHRIIDPEIKKKKEIVGYSGPNFVVHGGEPLLLGAKRLDEIFSILHSYEGSANIQTNGLLIDDEMISLFLRYRVHVGISLDGHTAKLNRGRWNLHNRSDQYISEKTELVLSNMRRLHESGVRMSVITVLRRFNASPEAMPDFLYFLEFLEKEFDIQDVRTNPGIVFDAQRKEEEELAESTLGMAFCSIADWTIRKDSRMIRPIRDAIDLLLGIYDQTCNFNGCDPFFTRAEIGIDADGILTNCLKSGFAIEGIQAPQAERYQNIRSMILPLIAREDGGCGDCLFWNLCQGGCPGEAIDNDWRNRSRFCLGYQALFIYLARRMKGLFPNLMTSEEFAPRRPKASDALASILSHRGSSFGSSAKLSPERVIKRETKSSNKSEIDDSGHGDYHGDSHGDAPHGDHTDARGAK